MWRILDFLLYILQYASKMRPKKVKSQKERKLGGSKWGGVAEDLFHLDVTPADIEEALREGGDRGPAAEKPDVIHDMQHTVVTQDPDENDLECSRPLSESGVPVAILPVNIRNVFKWFKSLQNVFKTYLNHMLRFSKLFQANLYTVLF